MAARLHSPVCCGTGRGCSETCPSRVQPSAAARAQTTAKTGVKHTYTTRPGKAGAQRVWRTTEVRRARSPWILSSPAQQRQTGWLERPPGPPSQPSTACPMQPSSGCSCWLGVTVIVGFDHSLPAGEIWGRPRFEHHSSLAVSFLVAPLWLA